MMNPKETLSASEAKPENEVRLRVGFLLMPRFTLLAFAGFVDALRLAADEGDRSRQRLCAWKILGGPQAAIMSSCGAEVRSTDPLEKPEQFDYIVVVGGLLHGGQIVPKAYYDFLREAAGKKVNLVGLCTGQFVIARAGLLNNYLACVSWFHRDEFKNEFPACRVTSNQMFVCDRDRLTCAGGTSVVHLAAFIIGRAVGRAHAVKALRIMLEEHPLPSRALQPEEVISERSNDSLVHKAMLLLEQDLQASAPLDDICRALGIGRRQLERRFQKDVGLSPAEYRLRLRMERAQWLLQTTDLDVLEVGLECGFHTGAHFSRTVRQQLGATPTQIRLQGR